MLRFVCAAFVVGACNLYSDSSPPDAPICGYSTGSDQELRNPETGACESMSSGCGCGDPCSPPAQPAWPSCEGPCEALDETTCLATAGCHAAYLEPPTTQSAPTPQETFWGCWDIEPLTPIEGSCAGLDALTCVQHDDCMSAYNSVALATPTPNGYETFLSCAAKVPLPACSTLTTQAACAARADCEPIYAGLDCTCDPNGCTCQVETFEYCQPS